MTVGLRLLLLAGRAGTAWPNAASLQHSSPLRLTRALSSLNSSQGQQQQQQGQHSSSARAAWGLSAAAAAMLLATSSSSLADAKRTAKVNAKVEQQQQQQKGATAAAPPDSLREYTADEVAQHKTPQDRVWVTYKDGVYDITDFIAQVRGCAQTGRRAHAKGAHALGFGTACCLCPTWQAMQAEYRRRGCSRLACVRTPRLAVYVQALSYGWQATC